MNMNMSVRQELRPETVNYINRPGKLEQPIIWSNANKLSGRLTPHKGWSTINGKEILSDEWRTEPEEGISRSNMEAAARALTKNDTIEDTGSILDQKTIALGLVARPKPGSVDIRHPVPKRTQ
jgi:hypothetical protein